ncbi:hypothetical protein Taro_034076 [Colocasia esculenta]|uniref:Uncharacterized protein n=1 Tax=Colocasia esculenta TaxID=4460 RepID=A0A843W6I8_COLES|nr:hypothetical protein [Colocasia esculenta]
MPVVDTGPQIVLFPMPHFRELRPESLKVPGMDLQLCGLQVWCWLVSIVLWLVFVERLLDPSSVTWHQFGCGFVVVPRSGRLLPLPGTPILGSLLRECSGLRECSSWQPSRRTLERSRLQSSFGWSETPRMVSEFYLAQANHETSQQRQGVCRAEETKRTVLRALFRVPRSMVGDCENWVLGMGRGNTWTRLWSILSLADRREESWSPITIRYARQQYRRDHNSPWAQSLGVLLSWLRHGCSQSRRKRLLYSYRNIVNVTVELSSFGQPKKEKLEPHLRPLHEATTTTWSKYFLGHR